VPSGAQAPRDENMNRPPNSGALPLYQTDLSQTPLPEILVKIHRYKVPGVIDCRQGQSNKKIYLDNGQISFAESSEVIDSLGQKLLREGRITAEQHEQALERLSGSGKRLGAVLSEMNAVDQRTLFQAVREQIESIVWSIFAWSDGAVSFVPGSATKLEFIKIEIPVSRAVLQGVRRMPEARALVSRLGTKASLVVRNPDSDSSEIDLNEEEKKIYDAVSGKIMLVDLINGGPLTPAENAKIVYGLYALQLIGIRQPGPTKVQLKTDGSKYTA
jgi:two-component system OmpR family response regulator